MKVEHKEGYMHYINDLKETVLRKDETIRELEAKIKERNN